MVETRLSDSKENKLKGGKSKFLVTSILLVFIALTVVLLPTNTALAQSDNTTESEPVLISEESSDGESRIGPFVKLQPVVDEIRAKSDGVVELIFSNPDLNEVILEADVYIEVPSGIYIYSEDFGMSAAAGTVYGSFSVPPGTARTISLNVKADETTVGETFFIHFTGLYWPQGNKDAYNPISLHHQITVIEASKNISTPTETASGETIDDIIKIQPYWWIILTVIVFGGIAIIFAVRRKTDVTIQS